MGNHLLDTSLLDRAIKFAVDAHSGTQRRGKAFPYVVHPLEAVAIVATMTSDQALLAAAALHDVVEDTDVSLDRIREEFGERIACMVGDETDNAGVADCGLATWHERKRAAMEKLSRASRESKIVAMGDKLSNMRAIARDYADKGDELWNLFHVKRREDHEWHYRGLAASLSELEGTHAYREFVSLVDSVFGPLEQVVAEEINLDAYTRTGEGYTAVSYTAKSGGTMIKLYNDFIPESIPVQEYRLARQVRKMGVQTPEAFRVVTCGGRTGLEFELIKQKKSFARTISDEPDRLREIARLFALEVKTLHSIPCKSAAFGYVGDSYCSVISASSHFSKEEKAKMLEFVRGVPKAVTCLHGDLHIGNIVLDGSGKVYWIDLADFGYGNPLFDLGTFYFNAVFLSEDLTRQLYHISKDQMLRVWEIFVREYFGEDASLQEVNSRVAPFAALVALYFGERDKMYPEMHEFIKNNLLK